MLVAVSGVGTATGQSAAENSADETSGGFGILPSFDYASGKYGGPDRTITRVFSLTVLYDQPRYTLTLTLPYIWQSGPSGSLLVRTAAGREVVIRGNQPLPATAVSATPIVQSVNGQGDVVAGATRFFGGGNETDPVYSLGAQYKFGTASADKGLGTRKDDYSLMGGISKKTSDTLTLSGTLGYTHYGSPDTISLKNSYWTLFSADNALSNISAVGATLFLAQKIADGSTGPAEATAYYRFNLNKTTMVRAYVLKGLSNGSANHGLGVSTWISF
jgi:hypothetical protein